MFNKTLKKWIKTYLRTLYRYKKWKSMNNEITTKFNKTHYIKGLIKNYLAWN